MAKQKKRMRMIYALYKGDENLGDGTAEELAHKFSLTVNYIYRLIRERRPPDYDGDGFVLIPIGKEEGLSVKESMEILKFKEAVSHRKGAKK